MPLTIDAAGRQLRAGHVTARSLMETCLATIDAQNPTLNAYISVLSDEALRAADAADAALAAGTDLGPLHGIPVSVKDLLDVAGTVTTAASHVRDGLIASRDAAIVRALRGAGAIIIGKTNLHEFALGTTNEDSAYGPARHPLDPSRSPGGSSGGSAISVATGMALASIGTDTGGSIRIPAAVCGLVGLKPAYGEWSTDGVVPLSRTLDHPGPLTTSVGDAALVHAVITGADVPTDDTSPRDLVLGVPRHYFCDYLQDEVRAHFERTTHLLRAAGVRVVDIAIPDTGLIAPVYLHLAFGDAAAYHGYALDHMPDRYTPNTRLRLELARYVLAEDYVRALDGRRQLRAHVDAALAHCDALALPTVPLVAPPLGSTTVRLGTVDESIRNAMLRLTQLFNITGHPALSLPMGLSASGLPTGLQLVGRAQGTAALLAIARRVERMLAAA